MRILLLLLWITPVSAEIQKLSDLRWQHRLMIGVHKDTEVWSDVLQMLKTPTMTEEIRDRKLLFLIVIDGQLYSYGDKQTVLNTQALVAEIQSRMAQYKAPGFALVGLDGSIKAFYPGTRPDPKLFMSEIDRMPMRQAELRSKQQ